MIGLLVAAAVLLALTVLNGVFAASELSLVSVRKSRLEGLAERGNRRARTALRLAENPGTLLSTVQIGITLIGTVAGAYGGSAFVPYLEPALRPLLGGAAPTVAFVVVVVAITYLSLVVGELVPKRLALRDPEGLAMRVAPAMDLLSRIARAPVWLLDVSSRGLLRLLGARDPGGERVTEEDVRALVEQAQEGGSLEAGERAMIERVLRFTDRRARELMTSRLDLVTLDLARPLAELARVAVEAGHDRYPAHRGNPDEVLGLLTAHDLLRAGLHPELGLETLLRPPLYVPESARGGDVLELFRERRQGAALVVDERGALAGMVTLGDLIAEVVGELEEGRAAAPAIVRREDGSFLVEGGLAMHDVRETLPLPDDGEEDFSTLAGYVLHHLGRLPSVGEVLTVEGWRLEVVDMDGNRVDEVLLTPPRGPQAGAARAS